jgi:hypothetical protein
MMDLFKLILGVLTSLAAPIIVWLYFPLKAHENGA